MSAGTAPSSNIVTFWHLLREKGVTALHVRFMDLYETHVEVELDGVRYDVWPPIKLLRDMLRLMKDKDGPHWFDVFPDMVCGEHRGWTCYYNEAQK
jgi:hypothetical protein